MPDYPMLATQEIRELLNTGEWLLVSRYKRRFVAEFCDEIAQNHLLNFRQSEVSVHLARSADSVVRMLGYVERRTGIQLDIQRREIIMTMTRAAPKAIEEDDGELIVELANFLEHAGFYYGYADEDDQAITGAILLLRNAAQGALIPLSRRAEIAFQMAEIRRGVLGLNDFSTSGSAVASILQPIERVANISSLVDARTLLGQQRLKTESAADTLGQAETARLNAWTLANGAALALSHLLQDPPALRRLSSPMISWYAIHPDDTAIPSPEALFDRYVVRIGNEIDAVAALIERCAPEFPQSAELLRLFNLHNRRLLESVRNDGQARPPRKALDAALQDASTTMSLQVAASIRARPGAAALLLDLPVEGDQDRAPNNADPTRTSDAPSSTATSRSPLMPMERWRGRDGYRFPR
jgi:hypothetical protein